MERPQCRRLDHARTGAWQKAAAKQTNIRAIVVLFSVFLTTIGKNWAANWQANLRQFTRSSPSENKNDSVNNRPKQYPMQAESINRVIC